MVAIEGFEPLPKPRVLAAFDRDGAPRLQLREPGLQLLHLGRAGSDRDPDRRGVGHRRVEVGLLAQQPDPDAAGEMDGAPVRFLTTRDDLQQRRLAGPVGTDQADPLAARERGGDRVEDHEVADLAADAFKAQDAHGA